MSLTANPVAATGWARCLPALGWLQGDAVAGLTAAAVVLPQAKAYGAIAAFAKAYADQCGRDPAHKTTQPPR